LVVMVGGIGVRILCPQPTLASARPGEDLVLYTHLIVREDDLSLVGFGSEEELGLFENLTRVQGVGPKLALSV
ncbi:OB-fold domain-containing protein, partial [Thauera sp. ZXT1-4]|uniref:OB-fold domain-containing protein n=1 Tax=Thauera sp. ZXT1-4 TaxID=3460294 RepID=UPI004040B6E3